MSTAGKVLVVLVLLLAPVWVILVSAVAELNKSGGEQVAKLKGDVANLEKQVTDTRRQIVTLKDQIKLEQVTMLQEVAAIRSHAADLEKARSETFEIAARVNYQVVAMQEAAKRSEATKELRVAEKTQEIAAKAAAEKEVERLKQEHAALVERLDKLRNDFKATLDSNRKLVDRLKAKRAS